MRELLWIPAFSKVPCELSPTALKACSRSRFLLQSSNQFVAVLKHFLYLGLKLCISVCLASLAESNPQQQGAESEAKLMALGTWDALHVLFITAEDAVRKASVWVSSAYKGHHQESATVKREAEL